MRKLVLIPMVAIAVAFGSPFASVAMAKEKPAQAAIVKACEDHAGICGVMTKVKDICIHQLTGLGECDHPM